MNRALLFCSILLLMNACSSSKKNWADFKGSDCAKYQFGRIDAKRLLTTEEKSNLEISGIHIQEFVFETQYLGSWDKKWTGKNLEKTPVKTLVPFSAQDKLASGMQLSEIRRLAETPGESMVLLQTIATIDHTELSKFGKLVFNREYFYRMIVPHSKLEELIEFPCIRLVSIVKDNYDPDAN